MTYGPSYQKFIEYVNQRKARLAAESDARFEGHSRCVLEIGCGDGDFLVAYGQENPQQYCLGLDVYKLRVDKGLKKRDQLGLENVDFIRAEATEWIETLPEHMAFDAVFLLFPDPWPKGKHFKKRLIQPDFLSLLAKKMAPEACLYFRTDHKGYFTWTQEHLAQHPDWTLGPVEWPLEVETRFQRIMGAYQSLVAQCTPAAVPQELVHP